MSGNIGYVFKGRYSRPRRITKLSVHSVDVVDRGAGVGTNVMIVKRDQTKEGTMMSTRETIAKSFQLRAQNKISDFELGVLHNKRAAELNMTIGQYYDTPEGRAARDVGIVSKFYSDQVRSAHGDGYRQAEKLEREEPFDHGRVPHIERAQTSGVDDDSDSDDGDDDGQVARQIEGMVLRLMEKNPGMTKDQAHLHIAATPEGKALLSRAHHSAVSKNMR
jgi:hypothetical protein